MIRLRLADPDCEPFGPELESGLRAGGFGSLEGSGELLVLEELPDIPGMDLSEEEFQQVEERGAERERTEPRAQRAWYDRARDRVVIELRTGVEFTVPRSLFRTLRDASPDDAAVIRVISGGEALEWGNLDEHYGVPALVSDLFGDQMTAAEMGRRGGTARTPAKVAAARANGRKGGRPRQTAPATITS